MKDIPVHNLAPTTRFAPGSDARMVQLLDASGRLVPDPSFVWQGSFEQARQHLREMTLIRRFDREGMLLQRQGKLSIWVELQGQEAVQVGVKAALTPDDFVFPAYREQGLAMLMGLPTERMLNLWGSTSFCDWQNPDLRLANYQMVIGAHVCQAVGYAMGMNKDGDPGATIVFFGDGSTTQGAVNEAFVFAATYHAPVVFVCTNNQWAISEPVDVQTRVPLYQRAWGFGIPTIQVDGNDVFAMQEVSQWALDQARNGNGPLFVEAYTYRMGAHTTSDDPSRYRTTEEVSFWRKRDPIDRLKTWLIRQNAWSTADDDSLAAEADALGAQMRAEAASLAAPSLPEMFDLLFTNHNSELAAQKHECIEWLAGFEDAS